MQILALGCTLPDSQVDNYDWGSAPSFFDYDAIVVDPMFGVSELIEGILRRGASQLTYSDEPIEDGPSTATSVGLADLLRRRQAETERLLNRGGLVVCFGYPDVPHPRVSGFTGCHRYYWLPAPEGSDYGARHVRAAHGSHVTVTDYEHPFAGFLEQQRNGVAYRALFEEGANSLGPAMKVIGRSPGGAAIAIELAFGSGKIIFLPAMPTRLTPTERSVVASGIVTAIRNTLLLGAEESAPDWLTDYPLPGIEAAEKQVDETARRLEVAEAEHEEARNEFRRLDRFRRLLWQEGKYGFELPVRDALTMLGFSNFSRPDEPASFYYDGETIFMECESSTGEVGMEPHYRLRQRIEGDIAREERRRLGLLVINGFRDQPPAERPRQYTDSLRIAAESMRYCVVDAARIFEAVRDHMDGKGTDAAFLKQLLTTEGVLAGHGEQASTADPAADQQ